MADKVRVGCGVTKNLGDYNSLRIDVSYEVEVMPGESGETAFGRAWELAEQQLEDKLSEAEAE